MGKTQIIVYSKKQHLLISIWIKKNYIENGKMKKKSHI